MKNEKHLKSGNIMTNGQKLFLIVATMIVALILNIPLVAFMFWAINAIFGTSIVIGLKTIVPTIALLWIFRLPRTIKYISTMP